MRRVTFVVLLAIAVGCGKKTGPTGPPAPSDAAFAEDSAENTLAWLAKERNALDASGGDPDGAKFKALAESMKGRTISWAGKLDAINPDKTYGLTVYTLHTDPPEPKSSEEARERHYAMVCKPADGSPHEDNAPFVRKPDLGFPSGAGDWHRDAKLGLPVKITGTITAVQLHRNSWVTGFGAKDRVVHTEVAVTLHITGGALAPVR